MKTKKSNRPPVHVRRSSEEILEAMKQAMRERGGGDPEVTEILIKCLSRPIAKDSADKAFRELMMLWHNKKYDRKYGV